MTPAVDWLASVTVGCVALLHVLFLVLEMFLWQRSTGRRLFGLSREFSVRTAALAANQGLYNGFLAAGLVWGLFAPACGLQIQAFFLCCVIVAGVFGAITVRRTILWVQALPGALALALVVASGT
jgi:putative membrane protein